MAQQLAQCDGLFAVGGELGPETRHGLIQIQLALADQLQGRDRRKGLGAGKQIGDGVAVPDFAAILVCRARPQIQHRLPADLHAQRSATLLRVVEQRGERFAYGLKLKLEMALNLHGLALRSGCKNGEHCSSD